MCRRGVREGHRDEQAEGRPPPAAATGLPSMALVCGSSMAGFSFIPSAPPWRIRDLGGGLAQCPLVSGGDRLSGTWRFLRCWDTTPAATCRFAITSTRQHAPDRPVYWLPVVRLMAGIVVQSPRWHTRSPNPQSPPTETGAIVGFYNLNCRGWPFGLDFRSVVKLVVQVPCLNEEETLPVGAAVDPAVDPGHRRDRHRGHRRRLHRPDGRGRPVARRHPLRAPRPQPGAGPLVPRRRRLRARARRGHRRQHRRRQPVPAGPDPRPGAARSSTGRADIVIADRQVHLVEHFSPAKKALQKLGSRVVNRAAGTDLPDAASGFRAYSRESLMRLNMVTRFSYCMETIIQAGNKRLRIESCRSSPTPRPASRGCSSRPGSTSSSPRRPSSAPTSCTSRT